MQLITPELTALLKDHFQVGAQGFRGRVEVDLVVPAFTTTGEITNLTPLHATVTNDPANTRTFTHPEYAGDGLDVTKATAGSTVGSGLMHAALIADFGTAFEVSSIGVAINSPFSRPHFFESSDDALTWTAVPGTASDDHPAGKPYTIFVHTFDAPITKRYFRVGYETTGGLRSLAWIDVYDWYTYGVETEVHPATYATVRFRPLRLSINKNLRMIADEADIELQNEDLVKGWGPSSVFPTNSVIRCFEWYGDVANETQTFEGLIDKVTDSRDPLATHITARSTIKRLLVQSFSTIAPQSQDEKDSSNSPLAVDRTPANGVYLNTEADQIVSDILDRAGWPTDKRDITPTSYVLDAYILGDGWNWAEAIIGEDRLTGYTGYSLWDDETGVIHFGPVFGDPAFTEPSDPVYTFRSGEDVVSLSDETDEYDLVTRVKARGDYTYEVLLDTWRELWRTSKFKLPVGLWHRPSETGHLRVLDRGTKRIYRLRQADRVVVSSFYVGGICAHPLGLSGDPSNADIFWLLEAPWRTTGVTSGNKVLKVRLSDRAVLGRYAIPDGMWSAIKVSASYVWLTNLSSDKFYKRSKATLASIASYHHTYAGVVQANPSGIMIDGTTLHVFWANGGSTARFLVCQESAPSTVTKVIKTAGTALHGGEMDTVTHTECYGDSDSLGLVAKFSLYAKEDRTREVVAEAIDTDLEDELGSLAQGEDREHDSHPGDPDHPFEIRRLTLSLSAITDPSQATETAERQLALLAKRRRVIDVGIVGNPALQKTDLVAIVDPVTGLSDTATIDTYRSDMSADGTYLGTLALIPQGTYDDAPDDEGAAADDPAIVENPTPDVTDPGADD